MNLIFLILIILVAPLSAHSDDNPYVSGQEFKPCSQLDKIFLAAWRKNGIKPAPLCSDAVFLRRVYLDLTGSIPTPQKAAEFIADKTPDKRLKLINFLLKSKNFNYYWAMRWCDILRVKSEFPINLWPNAVQAYHHWVWDSIRTNRPYDKFAVELLTSSGSNFRVPAVNFYRSTRNRTAAGYAEIAARAFLCSDFSKWPGFYRKETEKLFSRILIKPTDEWKEEIVCSDPKPSERATAVMPDGTEINIPADADPRALFADWLIKSPGSCFAEAGANRIWYWIFGKGLVSPPDDFRLVKKQQGFFARFFTRETMTFHGNKASVPEALKYLAAEFKKSGYDFKYMCRLITNSAVYQQSCIPLSEPAKAERYCAVYPVRRIDAEVLRDIFTALSGNHPKYMSVIPEPFTFIPPELPTIALADGSITSSFLEKFGKAARDSGLLSERNNSVTYAQRLYLLNSPVIQNKIVSSAAFRRNLKAGRRTPDKLIDRIYLMILSRYPLQSEKDKVLKQIISNSKFKFSRKPRSGKITKKEKERSRQRLKKFHKKLRGSISELVWLLVNTKEFLFRH